MWFGDFIISFANKVSGVFTSTISRYGTYCMRIVTADCISGNTWLCYDSDGV